uniref:Interleukin-18 n=1 Tax=Sparus aurata TaxID=8175 RepID=A0A671URY5_SPAAU
MATNCCSPVKFYCLNEKTFYFVDAETDGDLVDDSFAKSVYQACGLLIRGNNNKFLVLSDENEFKAQTLTGTQPECKFNIQFYNDSTLDGRNGRPVMLYANKANGKKMMVSCNDRHEIVPEEMEQLPADNNRIASVMQKRSPQLIDSILETGLEGLSCFIGF